jgi:hypothetical protein
MENFVEIDQVVENAEPFAEAVCACLCGMCFTIVLDE